ncbi:MAG: hypothetical protein GY932_14760 [Arcobacter sp.]|nr:hypothetical protein [Arcobacter sp.]
MISVSNKEAQTIFLTSNTKILNIQNKVDIIVSPEFYWVRKFEIPVKSETQARHVLPTLFEDIINDTSSLTYQVIKLEENIFLCFAYNNKKIYDAIKKLNISTSNICSIYFAQNECKEFKSFEIDNTKFMYTSEGILVKVPNSLLPDVVDLNKLLKNINLSSYKLQIKLYNDVLNTKYYYYLFAVFSVLIIINIFKYFSYSIEINDFDKKVELVKKQNKLPSSMLQVDAILKKYELKIKEDLKKREAIEYIFNNRKFDLKSLDIVNNRIDLEYLSSNKKEVENFLNKKYKVISSRLKSFTLKVSIKL